MNDRGPTRSIGLSRICYLLFALDWRWLRRRSDSPWHPRVRLYCQRRRGDWTDPLRHLWRGIDNAGAKTGHDVYWEQL